MVYPLARHRAVTCAAGLWLCPGRKNGIADQGIPHARDHRFERRLRGRRSIAKTARKILAHLPGGDLELEWSEEDNHVYLTGPAVEVFSGEWEMQPEDPR